MADTQGHCRHCDAECAGMLMATGYDHVSYSPKSAWKDGNCPACAEAERIANSIEALHVMYWPNGDRDHACYDEVAHGYLDLASAIARVTNDCLRGESDA